MSQLDIITHYFPDLTTEQLNQFHQLQGLYEEWNAQINVISRKDMDQLFERHVLHSLGIAKVMSFKPDTRIMDVGTGGGFPGIPLAILFPECSFHLVDSIGKKIKVVEAVSTGIGLQNLTAQHERAEKVKGQFHFIVSRAVTRMLPFWNFIRTKFARDQFNDLPNGVLYLKGGDLTNEMKEFNRTYTMFDLPDYFSEPFFETKKVIHVPAFTK